MSIQSFSLFIIGVFFGVLLYRFIPFKSKLKSIIKTALHQAQLIVTIPQNDDSPVNKISSEEKLLHCFYQKEWHNLRNKSLAKAWNYDFTSIDQYNTSVLKNRQHLQEYLGKWHEVKYKVQREIKNSNADVQIFHLIFETGIPNLLFEAYLVKPFKKNEFQDYGMVALHGHNSNAEKLVGIEDEDYGRKIALEYAQQGFTVIVPNLTNQRLVNNAISAHAYLYGYTLHGIMLQFILSCAKYLQEEEDVKHLGAVGISNGGLLALMATALSTHFKFVLASGALKSIYEMSLSNPRIHDRLEYYFYFRGPFWMEFDIAPLASLVIPNLLIFEVGSNDRLVKGWESQYLQIQKNYKELGLDSRLGRVSFPGGHEFSGNQGVEMLKQKIQAYPEMF